MVIIKRMKGHKIDLRGVSLCIIRLGPKIKLSRYQLR